MLTFLLLGLILSVFTLTLNIAPVKAGGTIYIRVDGSVDPPTAPIQKVGNVYTLTADIYDQIVIDIGSIIVDGNGHKLQGSGSGTGIRISGGPYRSRTSNVEIKRTTIINYAAGIHTYDSRGFKISNNTITNNGVGISLITFSNNNIVSNNTIINNGYGIYIEEDSRSNTLYDNNIINNGIGIYTRSSSLIYHNNFIDNVRQVEIRGPNVWDDGYPSGGNYWNDYTGVDSYSGPYQNETGSDGIGDTPYVIDANNRDRYPLMNPQGLPTYGYLTNIIFKDDSGITPLYTNPTQVQAMDPNGELVTFTSYSNKWLEKGTWTLKQILWQNNNIKPYIDPTYTPTPGGSWTINSKVYLISFSNSFKDSDGNNLYALPSSFKLTFLNGTTSAPLNPNLSYYIQNDTSLWSSIIWQGSEVTPETSFITKEGNPTVNSKIYSLTVDPVFYDNAGAALVQPSSWSIMFPNGTTIRVSSAVTYNQAQTGDYSITSITYKGAEVIPDIVPTTSLTSNKLWSPSINGRLPTSLAISLSSSTSFVGFNVEINGNLTCDGKGVSGTPLLLSYSVNNGKSWNDLTQIVTASDGSYLAFWIPSVTGNYLIRAAWDGNSTYPGTSTVVSLAVTSFKGRNVFSVTSNSTISALAFDSARGELSFTVTGPSDTAGYTIVYIAKSLIRNVADIKVYLDGDQLDYVATSLDDSWRLLFTYLHSTRTVIIRLSSTPSVDIQVTDSSRTPIQGCSIYVDGELKGQTDTDGILKIEDVSKGKHIFAAIKEGYITKDYKKVIRADTKITFVLERGYIVLIGSRTVSGDELTDVKIRVDHSRYETPIELVLKAGKHTFTAPATQRLDGESFIFSHWEDGDGTILTTKTKLKYQLGSSVELYAVYKPKPIRKLSIGAEAPSSVDRGGEFELEITVTNEGNTRIDDITVNVKIPKGFVIREGESASIPIDSLNPGDSETIMVHLTATRKGTATFTISAKGTDEYGKNLTKRINIKIRMI